jgi:GTP1/Obg family GTP-binding protein
MPVTAMELKVKDIVCNGRLPKSSKLNELRKLQSETRGVQRAAIGRPMTIDDGIQDDLRVVEKALQQLGADMEDEGSM